VTVEILSTKLYKPYAHPKRVTRPRLIAQLNDGCYHKLTLISAPAGFGKTTLLSEWISQREHLTCWLSLGEGDNDPARFWAYFVSAMRMIPFLGESHIGEGFLESIQASPTPERESLLESLIAEIAAVPERFFLILDNFHNVTEPKIQDELFYMLENIPSGPSGLHLIVSGRSDPPWPLARLRVRDQITELRTRDLRFTSEEATVFLRDVMQLDLSSDHIAELDTRTEGWAAGLQMAALSMRGRKDIAGFIEGFTGSHRFVLDYLVEEVLSQQSAEILDFLLKSSILERLTGSLCDAVTGKDHSTEILVHLEKANMFLVALDDQRNWYRYHPLFADLLQKQLRMRDPALLPDLHRRASRWYAQAGYLQEAVAHALNGEDWDFAASQIEDHVLGLIQQGEMTLARQWMSSLPDEMIRPRPILCVAQAWTSAKYASVELAEELLAQAEAALSKDLSQDGSLEQQIYDFVNNQIAVLQVVIARARGDSTQRQQELALKALDRVGPSGDTAARATLLLRLGFCYLDLGKDGQADRVFSQAFESGLSSGNHYAAHSANYGRMVIARRHGRLHELAAICHQILDAFREPDDQQPLSGIALTMLGGLSYERNKLDEAESLLIQGLKLVEQVGMTELLVKGRFALTCVKIAKGAIGSIPDLAKITQGGYPTLGLFAAALQARLHLLLARYSTDSNYERKAFEWAETQQLILRGRPTYDWEIYEKLIYARVLCQQYHTRQNAEGKERLAEVLDFITEQRQPLEELSWQGILVEVYVVSALILQTLGRNVEALTALEGALRLAEPQDFVRTFVDEGQPMKGLLQQVIASGSWVAYAEKLLQSFSDQSVSVPIKMQEQVDDLIEPLSQREQQVLHLLNSRLGVPEIAEEIHLAPTTVRTHVQSIYRKLDVHGRIEALQRAEELGLI
jgi:LuxR family maltose regulon positive regulatory protein